jgi:hypothetical protein
MKGGEKGRLGFQTWVRIFGMLQASTTSSARSDLASDGDAVQGSTLWRTTSSSRPDNRCQGLLRIRSEQVTRPVTPGASANHLPRAPARPGASADRLRRRFRWQTTRLGSGQVGALLRLPTRQHGGPGPRVTQPARRMLHSSNCTATCATTAPPRLRNQYRDSRRPSARPSRASLTRRSMRSKVGRQ